MKNKVLLVYTGGTIGMVQDERGSLKPFPMDHIYDLLPELKKCPYSIDTYQLDKIIDSSNMTPDFWVDIAEVIEKRYEDYDGFVVLHGTDTMAYTASALSFMFKNLSKPIILTGSQLPMGVLRTDGRENIICALELASCREAFIPEVCLFFENHLYRGNRSTKLSAENFDAFYSFNFPSLAKAGINFSFKPHLFLPKGTKPLEVRKHFDRNIAVLKLFPGITPEVVNAILGAENLHGVVVETFGSGNAPTESWFIEAMENALHRGILVLNVTQCKAGSVVMCQYEASCEMNRIGIIGGRDITLEAAVTKMMYLLGTYPDNLEHVRECLSRPLRGEMTESAC
ncbi:MAG: asparaginase [Bacteroidales bacterium]|nr:asparaginase [Bacteroidales bacterium]